MSERGGCCRCCCSFIVTSGLLALFMWLSLRPSKPECSIRDFYLPFLNTTDNSTAARNNHTIFLNLQLKNTMKDKGIFYDDLNLTFFYGPNRTLSIANYTVPGFYQGHHKKAQKKVLVEARSSLNWTEEAYRAVLNKSEVVFRVGVATTMRYKIMFWHTKRHGLVVGADVNVGYSGLKTYKKGVKLKSGGVALLHTPHSKLVGLVVILVGLLAFFW